MKRFTSLLVLLTFSLLLVGCPTVDNFPGEEFEELDDWQAQDTEGNWHDIRDFIDDEYNPFGTSDPVGLWAELHDLVEYKKDEQDEYRFAAQTFEEQIGDCEDQAILLCSALLAEGYDAWIAIGDTWSSSDSLHAWVVVFHNNRVYYFNETARPWFEFIGMEAYQSWWRVGWNICMVWNKDQIYFNPEYYD